MKIKEGFQICEVAGDCVVVPCGAAADDLHGMIKLNGTGRALWERLTIGAEMAELTALLRSLGASEREAEQDAADFVAQLKETGCLA